MERHFKISGPAFFSHMALFVRGPVRLSGGGFYVWQPNLISNPFFSRTCFLNISATGWFPPQSFVSARFSDFRVGDFFLQPVCSVVAVWYQSFSVDWVGTWRPSNIGHYVGVPDWKAGGGGPRPLGARSPCFRGLCERRGVTNQACSLFCSGQPNRHMFA